MIDFRFPARFTSSLSLQKSFISVFGFGKVLLRSRKKGTSLRSSPSSSATDDADDTRESASFHFQYRDDSPPSGSSSSWRIPRVSSICHCSRRYQRFAMVAASISMRIYLLKCNKLDRSQISKLSRR